MAWFKRNSSPERGATPDFPKQSVRQVVIFSHSWMSKIVVVHLETDSANELWLMLNNEWTKFNTESREVASSVMGNLLGGPDNLISAGMLVPESEVSDMEIWSSMGFGPEFYDDDSVDPLFLGISLADRVASGWIPANEDEIDEIYDFFNEVPLYVGFFAPFKQVLKALTDAFEQHQQEMSAEFASRFAGALGRGYSAVEGRLAHGENSPYDSLGIGFQIAEIQSLPALNGYKRPRMATLQFLSRKGLRFLKALEAQSKFLAATRFKVNFLVGPQLNTSFAAKSINGDFKLEDYSLKHQQILTYILYGHLGLASKDREARKVILGPRGKRHSLQLGPSFLGNLDDDSREVYAHWINEGLYTTHAPVARHALAISKVIESADFDWNLETTTLIANSDSEELQREAFRVYAANDDWAQILNPDSIRRVLDWVDEEFLEVLFSKELGSYQAVNPIQDWALERNQKSLTKREVLIALNVLKIDNSSLNPARASLLFQLIQQGSFHLGAESSDWPQFYFSSWQESDFLGFFGLELNDAYPFGALDLELQNPELVNYFTSILSDYCSRLWNSDSVLEVLTSFGTSQKPMALQILKNLLHDPQLEGSRLEILDLLQTADPTGNSTLQFLANEVERANQESLREALTLLGREAFATFWRRNSKEVEQLLLGDTRFASFFWTNVEVIPSRVREQILGFADFGQRVLTAVAPRSISKLNSVQEELLLKLVKKHKQILNHEGILRAMLVASSFAISQIATDHVKISNLLSSYWLLMLESNLPYPQAAAFSYLESQTDDSKFADTLLMALDSNNQQARTLAIRVLGTIENAETLKHMLRALVENRNSDTWSIVSSNLEKLDDPEKYQEFTRQVFLSRRKARTVKESIKNNVDTLIDNIEDAVEQDVLIRMAFSSVAKDREWALKKIALSQAEVAGATVETSWKSGLNV